MCPVGRHGIATRNGSQCDRVLIGALVAHHADTSHGHPHLKV